MTYTNNKNQTFAANQIVNGNACGTFVILGFRGDLSSEVYAQLKEVDPSTGETGMGEFALSINDIKEVA